MNSSLGRPQLGSRPFDLYSQRFFCGRDHEALLLAEWWQANNLTLVSGPAGRGKTSLLLAGVLPLLANGRHTPHVLPVGSLSRGLAFPVAALPPHNPYTLSLLCSWSPGESPTRLAGLSIRKFVTGVDVGGPILAAIDPADELVTVSGPHERHLRRFLAELKDTLDGDSRLHLLVVGRERATAAIAEVLGGHQYSVPALNWQSAIEAVTGEFAAVGRRFTSDAAEMFVTDVFTSQLVSENGAKRTIEGADIEPAIFRVACDQLWKSLPPDADPVTAHDIRMHADADAALAAMTAAVIAEVADQHGIPVRRLGGWLADAFITEMGTRNAQYEGSTTTARMPNDIVRALEDRHLLVSREQSGNRWYELISDRLLGPLRQLGRAFPSRPVTWCPATDLQGLMSAAERALATGDLDLAERHARGVLDAAESQQKQSSPGYLDSATAYSLLGNTAFEGGNLSEAEKRYGEAAQYFTAAADTKSAGYQLAAIGQVLLGQGRVAAATATLESAVRRVPNDLTVAVMYATALWQLGEGYAAVAVLTEALGIDDDDTIALRARGEILAYLGEARAALSDLDRVSLDRPATRAARGLALAGLGDRRAARREIEESVAAAERNGPVLLYAARAAVLIGDDTAAEEWARQAVCAADPPLSSPQREMASKLISQAR